MPITEIVATEEWASRPAIVATPLHGGIIYDVRASVGADGCELQHIYDGAGVEKTDETPLSTKLLFTWGLNAEDVIADDLEAKGFVPAIGTGAQVVYTLNTFDKLTGPRIYRNRIRISGTSDGLYIAPAQNEFHVPEGALVTIEMKTTQSGLFAELSRQGPNGEPMGNLPSYSRQSALHTIGCEVDYAGIIVYNRNDPKEHRLITLRQDAINKHAADALDKIRGRVRDFRIFSDTGMIPPHFNRDRSVRKGYCNGCPYRSMCHPDGIKMSNSAGSDENAVPVASEITVDEFTEKLRRLTEIKSVVSALTKIVNTETNSLRTFVQSEEYTELSVPVAITDNKGEELVGETIEYYDGVKSDIIDVVTAELNKYTAKHSGYAHIAVTSSPGKASVPAANLPAVLANFPELVKTGKDSTRTAVSRKAKPLTQKAMDAQKTD